MRTSALGIKQMAKQIVLVRINGEVHAKITSRPRGIVFALCDEKGTHLSLSKKTDSAFHVELSSDQPLSSVWDEARIGIARGLGWPRAERHANYVINRQYPLPAQFDPFELVSFCRPSPLPEQKSKYDGLPALNLICPILWNRLDLSLLFREPVDSESAALFPLGWAWLRLRILSNDTEPSLAHLAPLGG
jgi:hypothetical protein